MMTSDKAAAPEHEGYVWVWLPEATEPVVAGRVHIDKITRAVMFNYGSSYLERTDAMPLYLPELPLRRGRIEPLDGLRMAGALADAGPDGWGRRVIEHHTFNGRSTSEPGELGALSCLLRSGSDRVGALDFQTSASSYVARSSSSATLDQLAQAAELVERGERLPPAIDEALLHGSSIGGARPKVLLDDGDRKLIAKFSSSTDPWPVVRSEHVAMQLADRCGLQVANVELTRALGADVLLVERFDRARASNGGWNRRAMVSALTMLGLDEMLGRYASYADLAFVIRERFTDPQNTLRELFARIIFNVLVGNTDDHARNHAAFWDGELLTLTPLYDVAPVPRMGGETRQAMPIGEDGFQMSQVAGCVDRAGTYLLDREQAREIVEYQIMVIRRDYLELCDHAELGEIDRRRFWGTAFLNPYSLQGFG